MPRTVTLTFQDGAQHRYEGVPDDATPEQVQARVAKDFPGEKLVGLDGGKKPQANLEAPPASPKEAPPDSPLQFTTGNINKGIASALGWPADALANVLDLGTAAGSVVRREALGKKEAPAELLNRQQTPLTSAWIENQLRRAGAITPASDPTSDAGRYAAAALQFGGNAMVPMSRANSMADLIRPVPKAALAGLTSTAASDLSGGNPLAAQAGAMVPYLRGNPSPNAKALNAPRDETVRNAQREGIAVPPASVNNSYLNRIMTAVAGERKLSGEMSLKASPIFNDMVRKELGIPADQPLKPELLDNMKRAAYEEGYKPVIDAYKGTAGKVKMKTDRRYADDLDRIRREWGGSKEFGADASDKAVEAALDRFDKNAISPEGAMEQIRRLRAKASQNLKSLDKPENAALGFAQRKVADAMEGLIERNLEQAGKPEVVKNFREQRAQIAKIHATEDALNWATGNVSPAALARLADNGAPLSGKLREIAAYNKTFPRASQDAEKVYGEEYRASPLHALAEVTGLPAGLRHMMMSAPYQAMMARPPSYYQQSPAMILRQMTQSPGMIPPPPQD